MSSRTAGPTRRVSPSRSTISKSSCSTNLAPIGTWEPVEVDLVWTKMDRPCGHDRFLAAVAEALKADAEAKLRAAGTDVDAAKARLGLAAGR